MTDIVSNLEKVISELDERTSEVVHKDYGTDIASMVDHIGRQIDKIPSGGGSNPGFVEIELETKFIDNGMRKVLKGKTYEDVNELLDNGTFVILYEIGSSGIPSFYMYAGRGYSESDGKNAISFVDQSPRFGKVSSQSSSEYDYWEYVVGYIVFFEGDNYGKGFATANTFHTPK